jgi:hypothetical protein
MTMSGFSADLYELSKLLDHSNIKMTESLCESGAAA